MNASFTIVAKNYIGLAGVLAASVKKNAECDFFVFVADEFSEEEKQKFTLDTNIIIAKDVLDINANQWNKLSFQYNLIEFCTSIKASCFKYLFEKKGYNKILYLDPDIMVFNSLEPLYNQLEQSAIVLTPHILQMQTIFAGDFPDSLFLVNGIFNLGFLGLKNGTDTKNMINWWQNRLFTECYFDNDQGLATDQKWMNFLPSFFEADALHISRNPGYNAAPWNFCEREVITNEGAFFISNRLNKNDNQKVPLVFVHFSGYDYKKLSQNNVDHKNEAINHYADWEPVFSKYAAALKPGLFDKYMHLTYSYNNFSNGYSISRLHRRIYRRLHTEGTKYENLFSTDAASFYKVLKSKGLIDKTKTSADGITNKNVQGFSKKLSYVNSFFKLVLKIIGVRRYSVMIRFFRRYFKEESQAFLADKKFGDKLY